MADNLINFETEWKEENPTGEPCSVCLEPIFSKMHVLNVTCNGKVVDSCTTVCSSCYELVKK